MTQQEATKQLFEAAKSGDIDAAADAILSGADLDAVDRHGWTAHRWATSRGHIDVVRLLDETMEERMQRRLSEVARRRKHVGGMGELAGLVAGSLIFFVLIPSLFSNHKPGSKPTGKQQKQVQNDVEAAQRELRKVLKNPAVTDTIIEQIKDGSMIQKFTGDPEIMQNLQRLANAIEGDVKNPAGNWADKTSQSKGAQSLKRN